jgi:hypothetical protein
MGDVSRGIGTHERRVIPGHGGDDMSMDRREEGLRMKRTMVMGVSLVVLVLIGTLTVMGGQMPMGSEGGAQEQSSSQGSMMGRGMMGMTCPMMGDQMDPMGMMAMIGGGHMDPKTMGRMLELRGEVLKAVGDVLVKHGQAMRKEP